jgi:DNA-binding XRE family transcriptional regulator
VAKIKKFTTGEKFRILRRRLQLTQVEQARRLDISRGRIIALEADRLKPDAVENDEILDMVEGEFTVHEQCFIKRERAGKTQRELAATLGCSVQHIRDMETGRVSPEKLRKHWKC